MSAHTRPDYIICRHDPYSNYRICLLTELLDIYYVYRHDPTRIKESVCLLLLGLLFFTEAGLLFWLAGCSLRWCSVHWLQVVLRRSPRILERPKKLVPGSSTCWNRFQRLTAVQRKERNWSESVFLFSHFLITNPWKRDVYDCTYNRLRWCTTARLCLQRLCT